MDLNYPETVSNTIHWLTLLTVFFLGTIPAIIFHLIRNNRLARQKLGLSIRLEQANHNLFVVERQKKQTEQEIKLLLARQQQYIKENSSLQAELVNLKKIIREKEKILHETREQLEKDFQIIASQIIDKQSRQITESHTTNLGNILVPLKEQLQQLKVKADQINQTSIRENAALCKEIEMLRQLNQQISDDARNLAHALQGSNKQQGQWGEMILEKILQESGLRKDHEFLTQVSLKDESGRNKQPDVIVRLPGNRNIIIDAKVSLTAWTKACRAEDEKREQYIKEHVSSVKNHINNLASKQYYRLKDITSLEFTILFMASEPAFQAAIGNSPELNDFAMNKKIILSSPTTLMATLRIINNLWRLDEQAKNGLLIAKQAGNLYDKFVGFMESFEDIGFRLDQSKQSWQTARNRLVSGRGCLLDRIESLKDLGVQPQQQLVNTINKRSIK